MPNGLEVIEKATKFLDSSITADFGEPQTKRAPKNDEDCTCPDTRVKHKHVVTVKSHGGPTDSAKISIGVTWEYNGCDVIGASPYLMSASFAKHGWNAVIKFTVLPTDSAPPSTCECCEKAACVRWTYTIRLTPPIDLPFIAVQATSSGTLYVGGGGGMVVHRGK